MTSQANGETPWREALQAWVDWNDAHERVTREMFAAGHNQKAVEDALDRVEQLRRRALELSRKLLGR
ncbi:MAG: hypothetical protein HYS13_12480 [Planctomycetia bacterium]|nr:hypothetical protein [Planctomycetia bacterium]